MSSCRPGWLLLLSALAVRGGSANWIASFKGDVFESGAWSKSLQTDYTTQDVVIEGPELDGHKSDQGLLLRTSHKKYGVGAMFDEPVTNDGTDLVVQYEVQLRDGLACGGAYLKLLRDEPGVSIDSLDNNTPYTIMFGPDKCGATNKVHFILQHKNPKSGEWEEKHLKTAPRIKDDKQFHLYTLIIRKNNEYEILIDKLRASSGSLLESMDPSINPPKTIDDPDDSKPEDWADSPKIPDPEAAKPEDWDEDAPPKIPDETAEKPEGWLDDAPQFVPDPAAEKPEDWEDEEDGEWEAPNVPNPACEAAPGCGKWERPMKVNPAFKGKWTPPMIDNPAYKGPWSPRQIENPDYFEDLHPSNVAPIAGVAVEVWTTVGGIWIDNVVIGHDVDKALAFAEETWRPKHDAQAKLDADADAEKDAKEKAERGDSLASVAGWKARAEELLAAATELSREKPAYAAAFTTVLALLVGGALMCCSGGGRRSGRRGGPVPAEGAAAAAEQAGKEGGGAASAAGGASAEGAEADEDENEEDENEDGEEDGEGEEGEEDDEEYEEEEEEVVDDDKKKKKK